MKLKNHIFRNGFIPALNKLLEQPLDIKESYKLIKFVKELQEKEVSFNDAMKKIFEKYGEKTKDGQQFVLKKDKEEEGMKEIKELIEIEEEYEFAKKISLPEDVKITAADLAFLEDVVEVPKE